MTYVFAISSKKHRFKGIVINALTDEDSVTLSGILKKIKNGFIKIMNSIKPGVIQKDIIENKS